MSDEQTQSSQGALGAEFYWLSTELAKQPCIRVSFSLAVRRTLWNDYLWAISCKVIDFMITMYIFFWSKSESTYLSIKIRPQWMCGEQDHLIVSSLCHWHQGCICGCPRVRGVGRARLIPKMQGSHCLVCTFQAGSLLPGISDFTSPFPTDFTLLLLRVLVNVC